MSSNNTNYIFTKDGQLLISVVQNTLKDLSGFRIKKTIDFDINLYGNTGTIKFSVKPKRK